MFTGIVQEIGTIGAVENFATASRLTVSCARVLEGTRWGDSIAVDGVCLTVAELGQDWFTADVMKETLQRTTLGEKNLGDVVNLERALAVGDRLGGHLVQGHVDAVGELVRRTPGERWEIYQFRLPEDLARYVVAKGSIAVNGTSLTVADVDGPSFTVSLIPATLRQTTLGALRPGQSVNLEVDVVGKYLEKLA